MEVTRQQVNGDPADLRIRQLRARQMLRGELEGEDLERYVEERVVTTTVDKAVRWARGNSFFPLTFGLACCAIEQITAVGARMDMARFGWEVFRGSPRQSDLIILSGRVSIKMAPVIRRIYDQMLEPKWVIAMGACSSSAGMFNNYAVVQGVDHIVPVDIYLPGCPPHPEMLMDAILKLHDKVGNTRHGANRDREITELEHARLWPAPLRHPRTAMSRSE